MIVFVKKSKISIWTRLFASRMILKSNNLVSQKEELLRKRKSMMARKS